MRGGVVWESESLFDKLSSCEAADRCGCLGDSGHRISDSEVMRHRPSRSVYSTEGIAKLIDRRRRAVRTAGGGATLRREEVLV